MGCDVYTKYGVQRGFSFNPRTRVGCDYDGELVARFKTVSIHAPVWGATISIHISFSSIKVSIHAPVWGATNLRFLTANPRTVSIHAPVWGATLKTQQDHLGIGFQSTHPCGVRPYTYLAIRKSAVSIHAPVWGATGRTNRLNETCSFNPRTRVGCDTLNFITYMRFLFQSTHPCGVRHCQH